jgi:hypothetical protein
VAVHPLDIHRQEIARRRRLLAEREVADLAPVDLRIFARQALKADRDLGDRLAPRLRLPLPTHGPTEGRKLPRIRLLGIVAGQLEHPHRRQALLHPARDPLAVRIGQLRPTSSWRRLIDRLGQRSGHRGPTPSQLARDLALALPPLVQQVDRAPFHPP